MRPRLSWHLGALVAVLVATVIAAVALQAAADDSRIVSVVAAETFADLRTIVAERAPSFLPHGLIDSALKRAARDGRFQIDDASPEAAAARINVPVAGIAPI
jgi:hypothetical protein